MSIRWKHVAVGICVVVVALTAVATGLAWSRVKEELRILVATAGAAASAKGSAGAAPAIASASRPPAWVTYMPGIHGYAERDGVVVALSSDHDVMFLVREQQADF